MELIDFKITKGAPGDFFRNEDNPGYDEVGDQVLSNFLNGLIIYKRGRLLEPKKYLKEDGNLPGNERKDIKSGIEK